MTSRIQLALNVSDLEAATEFYRRLFDTEPHKVRPGYVNFAIADPPLKLALFENPEGDDPLNHLGVEVIDSNHVEAARDRFATQGLDTRASLAETCCHATQDKVYVTAPDVPLGFWEFYTVVDDEPAHEPAAERGACCG